MFYDIIVYIENPQNKRNKTARIYQVLLSIPYKKRTPYSIAKLTGISPSWVYYVLDILESKGLIVDTEVIQPRELLLDWANRPGRRRFREYHIRNPEKVLLRSQIEYVLTSYFAENLVGQYLFPRYFDV